jgi:hypothetical protein
MIGQADDGIISILRRVQTDGKALPPSPVANESDLIEAITKDAHDQSKKRSSSVNRCGAGNGGSR